MPLLYHAYVYLEFLILACTIYILAPISKYEKVDENISGDMLLALSKFFKVPVDYILRKDEEEQQREQDNKREIMELYRDMDQYNRDTWIIIGKRLLGGQLHKYNEDSIIEKRLKE